MRHHNRNKKLGMKRDARRALFKSMACSLIRDGAIKTGEVRAKQLRPFIERLVTKAKVNTLANRRHVFAAIGNQTQTARLFSDIAPKYADKKGGYTRIVKLPIRTSDATKMALIEFV